MTLSHTIQWIEDAEARQFCLDISWSRVPATTESHSLHLGQTILQLPARIANQALVCARRIASASRNATLH
jgi:hypothetical protein